MSSLTVNHENLLLEEGCREGVLIEKFCLSFFLFIWVTPYQECTLLRRPFQSSSLLLSEKIPPGCRADIEPWTDLAAGRCANPLAAPSPPLGDLNFIHFLCKNAINNVTGENVCFYLPFFSISYRFMLITSSKSTVPGYLFFHIAVSVKIFFSLFKHILQTLSLKMHESRIRIRINWANWIRIQSWSRSETLLARHGNMDAYIFLLN